MRVLFDQGTPAPLRGHLKHDVATVLDLGWSTLSNGEVLGRAEAAGFDVLVTTDQNLKYQQNLPRRRVAIHARRSPPAGIDYRSRGAALTAPPV